MDSFVEMVGFFASHAIWCVSEGETLVPIGACESTDGSRKMFRFVFDELKDGVSKGREWLVTNPEGAAGVALIYDGFITLPTGKTDALLVEARVGILGDKPQEFTLAIPYRHAGKEGGFAVHRPKLLRWEGAEIPWDQFAEVFFRGVDKHEKGSVIWSEHLDQSK